MTQPIRVFYAPLSGRFFATNKWRIVIGDGIKPFVKIYGQKFDVTDDIGSAVNRHGIVFEPMKKSRKRKAAAK